MSSSNEAKVFEIDQATSVEVKGEVLILLLLDGRELRVPIQLIPSVSRASEKEQKNVKLIAQGTAVCWPSIDEHLSVEGLLSGRKIVDWQTPKKPKSKAVLKKA